MLRLLCARGLPFSGPRFIKHFFDYLNNTRVRVGQKRTRNGRSRALGRLRTSLNFFNAAIYDAESSGPLRPGGKTGKYSRRKKIRVLEGEKVAWFGERRSGYRKGCGWTINQPGCRSSPVFLVSVGPAADPRFRRFISPCPRLRYLSRL